jgi:deoxyribonuclease V
VVFAAWTDDAAVETLTVVRPIPAEYEPGELYRRELPPILEVLACVGPALDAIVVDGYVWLAGRGPGLGAHLHRELAERVAVVGVAKSAWKRPASPGARDRAHRVVPVVRGRSARPLFVTAAGMDVQVAAARVKHMHGAHRLPTLLKAVDALARGGGDRVVPS